MAQTEYVAPIRIEKIELKNFKGVSNGIIEFNCLKNPIEKETLSDILGIYGQNGSGKTTLLEALHIVKLAMMGEKIPEEKYGNIISQNAKKAEITVTFQFKNQDESFYHVDYHLSLENKTFSVREKKDNDDQEDIIKAARAGAKLGAAIPAAATATMVGSPIVGSIIVAAATTGAAAVVASKLAKNSKGNKNQAYGTRIVHRLVLSDEVLSLYGTFNGVETRLGPVFDTRITEEDDIDKESVFLPKAKHKLFFPNDTALALKELQKYKSRYKYNSKSFIFCDELSQMFLDQNCESEYANIIMSLKAYAIEKLIVLNTNVIRVLDKDEISIYFANRKINIRKSDSSVFLDDEGIEILKTALEGLNVALKQIIPGIQLESVKQMGVDVVEGTVKNINDNGYTVTVYSVRDNIRIPIAQESAGIIRLISILGLFSYAFVDSTVTVAIDEIDAGVYEYLLGELLLIFEEYGAGQLIFTCHNLRPMEVLNKKFIYFTTTNPGNRYLKPKSIRKENNLRDVYLREIINGGQDEELYDNAKHGKIAAALQKAGEIVGKD